MEEVTLTTEITTRDRVDEIIQKKIEEKEAKKIIEICNPMYYKNQYLKYAFTHNTSPQCVQRVYMEMLMEGYKYTQNPSDLLHVNQILERMKMIYDESMLKYLNKILDKFREETEKTFPYLIMDVPGRIKSFKSFEAKTRTRIMKQEIYREIMNELSEYEFTREEENIANEMVTELIDKNSVNFTTTSDTFGMRIILYSYNHQDKEKYLTNFLYKFFLKNLEKFLETNGIQIIEKTDYIKNPKDNGYRSLHLKVKIVNLVFEIQIRTVYMHYEAEKGIASHSDYKDTEIQNFMQDFLYEISEKHVEMNEKLGLLKEQTFSPTMWCFIPNEEIPKSPDDIQPFDCPGMVKRIVKGKK